MIMDKGMGLGDTLEMLSVAGKYIDFIKFAFGTSALYNGDLLKKKIELIKSYDIQVYPGGTFLEIAIMQKKMAQFLDRAKELGFSAIEVSDGTIHMSPDLRSQAITMASEMGFQVISEVGKKDIQENLSADTIIAQLKFDLICGSSLVILEARESGLGIGIFNEKGDIKNDFFEYILSNVENSGSIMWEAPLKKQQQDLIIRFGPNVNLGNIPPAEALALESLRVGYRGDTLKTVIGQSMSGCSR
jgi:phosphosulfolactate synthase